MRRPCGPTSPSLLLPFAAGGGTDIGEQILAQRLSQSWEQPVLVDNRAGAGGNVGLELVARAKPDGYTLLIGNVGTQSINPTLYRNSTTSRDTAFVPVGQFAEPPLSLW